MSDLDLIPTDELQNDLAETRADIRVCQLALGNGIETYGNNSSVRDRLKANYKIEKAIIVELGRRGVTA